MLKIAHRINTVEALESTDKSYGVEVDLRHQGERIILQHEPFVDGEDFAEWLKRYRHAFLVLNIKSEGIEDKVRGMLLARGIKDYFFLDVSFPAMVKLMDRGEKKIAVRFSEFEGLDTVINLSNKVDWVWVDCFKEMPLTRSVYDSLKKHFKICMVSPELQGQGPGKIALFKEQLRGISLSAVCTKAPELW